MLLDKLKQNLIKLELLVVLVKAALARTGDNNDKKVNTSISLIGSSIINVMQHARKNVTAGHGNTVVLIFQ